MIPEGIHIYLADEPADMRKQSKGSPPSRPTSSTKTNALFVFVNKKRDWLKVL